jgi:hypothetical protein
MKPGSKDIKTNILISGDELTELKRHTWLMDEAFGLDSRIENYKGTKPIGLYSWDFDCLIGAIDYALDDPKEYQDKNDSGYLSLLNLHNRLKEIYGKTYD